MIKNTLNSIDVVVGYQKLFELFTYKVFDMTVDPYFMRDESIDRDEIIESIQFRTTIHDITAMHDRINKNGIPYYKLNGSVRYSVKDIKTYLKFNRIDGN